MRRFAELYEDIDSTTSTNLKVEYMADYFRSVSQEDAAWALFFLTGRRLKRFVSSRLLWLWMLDLTKFPEWLADESYESVGDTAECCSLLLDQTDFIRHDENVEAGLTLSQWMEIRILPLIGVPEEEQKRQVLSWWSELDRAGVFILNKLLTGAFRVGVSQSLVARALVQVSGLSASEIAHRLMGDWKPEGDWYHRLVTEAEAEKPVSKPYPFFLASPLEKEFTELGSPAEWQAEWKWDGIRSQLIRRGSDIFLWSRGEELNTERFPEIEQAAHTLPSGVVIDGEILAMQGEKVLPFSVLQTRIGRKKPTKAFLQKAPAAIMAYDLLEYEGRDLRELPLSERRELLEKVIEGSSSIFKLSPSVSFDNWSDLATEREKSRHLGVEGLMLKRLGSPYHSGRKRGDWWKWKVDPFTIDAVLIYAQAGSGRRANLFTDYTFALWRGEELVPIAKAYSGLDNDEINRLDSWIRKNTIEKFGPVRSVRLEHVFELAFEGIAASPRHKSGIAVRFPRISRWRHDKKPADADKLETLKAMIDETNAEERNSRRDPPTKEEARSPRG
ncbi:MAG: ATP-dependent DNA ligase [Bdellovibrionota bacterium]